MLRKLLLAFSLVLSSAGAAMADPITVDEVLYDPASVDDRLLLSGTVDMTFNSATNTLQIVLTNTSADGAGSAAGVLLTGIGFELPSGTYISGGSVNMGSSTAVNFTAPASGNVSSEWGYENDPLHSGSFLNDARLEYNTAVGSMVSMTTFQFASGSIGAPPDLGGPDFGLISATEGSAGGQEAIRSSVTILLNLGGTTAPSNLVDVINSGNVALSFGSPTASVPEPASLSLLAVGLAFGASAIRKRRKK